MQLAPLVRVVDDPVGGEDGADSGPAGTERPAFPQRIAVRIDDARRVEDVPADETVVQAARDPERDEAPPGDASSCADADDGDALAHALRDTCLGLRRAGQGHPVKVHAMLRTVSLTLPVASYAAEGSKPEWIPQCSHRGSFPGP